MPRFNLVPLCGEAGAYAWGLLPQRKPNRTFAHADPCRGSLSREGCVFCHEVAIRFLRALIKAEILTWIRCECVYRSTLFFFYFFIYLKLPSSDSLSKTRGDIHPFTNTTYTCSQKLVQLGRLISKINPIKESPKLFLSRCRKWLYIVYMRMDRSSFIDSIQ